MPKEGELQCILKTIKFQRRQDLENPLLEIIVIEIFNKNAKFILLACYYRPPRDRNICNLIITIHSLNILKTSAITKKSY